MGANEEQLAAIRRAGPFAAPQLSTLRNSLAALAVTIKEIAASPGWQGLSADAASSYLEGLSRQYFAIEAVVADLQAQVDRANEIRSAALADFAALPSAQAPAWVHDTLDAFDFPGLPDPVDLAQGGLQLIEDFLGGQREQAAGRILAAYAAALEEPSVRTEDIVDQISRFSTDAGSLTDDETTTGSWTQGGFYQGRGYDGVEYHPGGSPSGPPSGPSFPGDGDDVVVGVDDPNTGVLPGGGNVPGGSSGSGGAGGSGGLGTGIAAAGVGAGALAAARMGAGAAALAGRFAGGARVGTGGLLGGGMAPAAAAGGSSASRGATGTRGGSGLLGAGGAQGAGGRRTDDKKARGRGLGGPIAPRLDDEDEAVLPGEGARAGGRGDAPGDSEPLDD